MFYRVMLTAITLAVKVYEDNFLSNAAYAEVTNSLVASLSLPPSLFVCFAIVDQFGGVSLSELNRHESTLITLLNFNLLVSLEEFEEVAASLLHGAGQWSHCNVVLLYCISYRVCSRSQIN